MYICSHDRATPLIETKTLFRHGFGNDIKNSIDLLHFPHAVLNILGAFMAVDTHDAQARSKVGSNKVAVRINVLDEDSTSESISSQHQARIFTSPLDNGGSDEAITL
mmetsp:Transcript_36199/g.87616  ORF Transcript_36199/g.87616 Transcript_36199/m.87616 type:complete len:107 (-) Transcript_36199:1909-2229(-)